MSDLISRQAAIDAVSQACEECRGTFARCKEKLLALPPAQQERIIYGNMSDEEFEKWLYGHGICNPNIRESIPCDVVPLLIDNAISELPSAQPQRKTGRWKVSELPKGKMKYCSECGFGQYIADERQYNFCPNCGALMDGEVEGRKK